jgi:hypothetical protein
LWWANQRYPSQKKRKLNFGSTQLIDMSCIMLTQWKINYFKVFSFFRWCGYVNFLFQLIHISFKIILIGEDWISCFKLMKVEMIHVKTMWIWNFVLIMQDSRKTWKYINIWTWCQLIIIDSIKQCGTQVMNYVLYLMEWTIILILNNWIGQSTWIHLHIK